MIKDGDMFLMDAGVQQNGYCSDITTTWPANGRFTEKQAQIYNIVLGANR
jgi:Xaa-Pro dipeptidase